MKRKRIYALYKGDKHITDGTKKELAEYLKVKVRTINFYKSPTYQKRGKEYSNRFIVIFIGEEI